MKKCQMLPTKIVFASDAVFEIFIDISENLHVDLKNSKLLNSKS